jgi:hypothetical protein
MPQYLGLTKLPQLLTPQAKMVTNLEKWRFYNKDITSPDIYINVSFYYMIASALQRRVYLGSDERPLFGNLYIILVGEPGVGKGLVIKPVYDYLRFHKLNRLKLTSTALGEANVQDVNEEVLKALIDEYQSANNINLPPTVNKALLGGNPYKPKEVPLLIPMAADATTYEALVESQARAFRTIRVTRCLDSKLLIKSSYSHSSICFALEEISSLFRKHTEDVVNYLVKHKTVTMNTGPNQGLENIRTCLNFLKSSPFHEINL